MVKQHFSFGIGHALSNYHVTIEAETADDCREEMMEMFGKCWGFQYDEIPTGNKTTELPMERNKYGYLKLVIPDEK